jgi:DNA-binding response OmpR family regulator
MKGKSKKILLVEDEPALLMVLADKFRREGFQVFEASDGEIALESAVKYRPDIIVLDIVMPSMDGLTMLKKLRENKWGNDVPVLILSNLSDPEQINEAAGSGAIDFLVKSNWGLDDVVAKVRQTLQKSVL